MAYKIIEGIIKLIQKSAFSLEVIDWSPISLLNTIYKLIAKLMAGRLSNLMSRIINE